MVRRVRLAADPRRRRRRPALAPVTNARRPPPRLRAPGAAGVAEGRPPRQPAEAAGARGLADLYRGGFGVALVLGAALLFLYANGVLGQARDVVLAIVVAARRARPDPRAVPLAPGPQPRRRARRADPLAGARRARRAPARLGAADADPDAEARRRPARGGGARPAPGARAARLAVRRLAPATDGDSLAAAIEAAAAEVEDAHAVAIDVVAVGDRPLDERGAAARRGDARGAHERREVRGRRRRRRRLRRDGARTARRSSSATAAPASTRRPCRPTAAGAGVDHRQDGAPRRHGDDQLARPAPGPRSSWRWRCEPRMSAPIAERRDRRRPRDLPQRRPRRARGPGRGPRRRRLGRGGGADDRRRAPGRRPARRPHAGRRRRRGDPPDRGRRTRRSASSPSRSPTPPRT